MKNIHLFLLLILGLTTSIYSCGEENAKLETPTLTAPLDGANVSGFTNYSSYDFEWLDVVGATVYEIEISSSNTFATSELFQTSTSASLTVDLTTIPYNTYFWRVKAKGTDYDDSDYSAVQSFIWQSSAQQLALISPLNFATNIPINLTLTCEAIPNALSYKFTYFHDSNFKFEAFSATNSVDIVDLIPDTEYRWRVEVADMNAIEYYSDTWTFTTQ